MLNVSLLLARVGHRGWGQGVPHPTNNILYTIYYILYTIYYILSSPRLGTQTYGGAGEPSPAEGDCRELRRGGAAGIIRAGLEGRP